MEDTLIFVDDYTYFERDRKSRFSTSNQLLRVASRWIKLTKEDFDKNDI